MMIKPTVTRELMGGTQHIYQFPNNYGASVVKHSGSYGYEEGLWELTILKFDKPDDTLGFRLVYDTPITDDVIGNLTEADIQGYLEKIKLLE
jgi:hypothetical protein